MAILVAIAVNEDGYREVLGAAEGMDERGQSQLGGFFQWLRGCFPDGNSALMPVCARLRHVAGTELGSKKYMNMKRLEATMEDAAIAG